MRRDNGQKYDEYLKDLAQAAGIENPTRELMHILRVLARHRFLRAVLGKKHWPPPKVVRETIEELGLTFLKFGQVLCDASGSAAGRLHR